VRSRESDSLKAIPRRRRYPELMRETRFQRHPRDRKAALAKDGLNFMGIGRYRVGRRGGAPRPLDHARRIESGYGARLSPILARNCGRL